MYRKSLLLALALALGAANAQDATDTTTDTTETTIEVELTGLDHLLRLLQGGAVVTVTTGETTVELNADTTMEDLQALVITDETVIEINGVTYTLAGSLTDPGMPKVTVELANGATQTIAMPAALNRVAHGLNRTRPAPQPEQPEVEEPVIKPELPAQATEHRPADTGRPSDLPAAARGRGK